MFMTNSFIRPSDISVLKHKHVAIVRRDETDLRLTHPRTKGHANAVISLEKAVDIYQQIVQRQRMKALASRMTICFSRLVVTSSGLMRCAPCDVSSTNC